MPRAPRRRPLNVAALVGHTTLARRRPCRSSTGRPAKRRSRRCAALVREALAAGAIGMSTGTFYPPAVDATTEEIIEVGRPLTERKALYVTHMRDESDHVMESLDETFRIGRELGVPVVVSHHKVQNTPNFGRSQVTLPFIREAMQAPVHRPGLLSLQRRLHHDPHRPRHARRQGADRFQRAAPRMRRPRPRRHRRANGASPRTRPRAGCSRAARSTS